MNRSYNSQLHNSILDSSMNISTDQMNLTDISCIENCPTPSQNDSKLLSSSKESFPGIMSFLLMCIANQGIYSIRVPESLVYLPSRKMLYLVYTDNIGKIIVDSGPSVLYKFFDILEAKSDKKVQYYHVAKGYSRNYNHKTRAIDNWKSFENKGQIHAILKNFNISRISYWIRTIWHRDSNLEHFKIIQRKQSLKNKHRSTNSLSKTNTAELNYAGRLHRTSFFPSLPMKSNLTFCSDSSTKLNDSFIKHSRASSHKKIIIPQQTELLPIESDVNLIYPTRHNSPTNSKRSLFIQPIQERRKVNEIENMTIELSRLINSFVKEGVIKFKASFMKDECDRWCLYSVKSSEFTPERIITESGMDKNKSLAETLFRFYKHNSDTKYKLDFSKSRSSILSETFSKTRHDRILKPTKNASRVHKMVDLRDSIEKSKHIYLTNFSKSPQFIPKKSEIKPDSAYSQDINKIIHKFDATVIHARECLEHFTIAHNLRSYTLESDTDILNNLSRDHYTYVIEHPKLLKYFKSRCISHDRLVNHGFIRALKQPVSSKLKENISEYHKGLKIKYTDFDLYIKIFIGVMKKHRILKQDRERMCKRLWIYAPNIIEIYDTPVSDKETDITN